VASAGQDHTLQPWNAEPGVETAEVSFSSENATALYSVAFSPSANTVAVAGDTGAYLFDPDEARNLD
jgi:hypothetical protein